MEHGLGLLLDSLYTMSEYESLSTLKYDDTKEGTVKLLKRVFLSRNSYSLEQWSYALSYITGRNIIVASEEELNRFIQDAEQTSTW